MEKVLLLILLSIGLNATAQDDDFESFYNKTDDFLASYVHFGRVDYRNIDTAQLNALTDFIETASYQNESENTQKAFLINAYNLFVIDQVVKNYPISSPMDVDGFFKVNTALVGGELMTLNHLENEVLNKQFPDPRYHFVLVCGAIDCPPLHNEAFRPESLELQLDNRTTGALNNENFIYEEDGTVYLSQIFEWYGADFGKKDSELLEYINSYRKSPFESTKTKFYEYDWSLNDQLTLTGVPMHTPKRGYDTNGNIIDLQTFTAGTLLGKGQMDFTMFNTVYTQTRSNWLGNDFSGVRETFMTSLWQFSIGVDKQKRVNLGLDLSFRASGRSSDSTASGVTAPFAFSNTDSTRYGLTAVGLRAKVAPFKSVRDLSLQTTVYIPTIGNPEGTSGNTSLYWADWDRVTMWNQIFYTKTWSKFQLFTEIDALIRFKYRANQISHMDIPMTVIGSFFPTRKWTIYGLAQHTPRATFDFEQANTDWVIPANWTTLGAGLKYQPISNLTIELLYTSFIRGVNSGLGNTFNLGIKYVTK